MRRQRGLTIDRSRGQKLLFRRRISGTLVEYGRDQLQQAARYVLSIRCIYSVVPLRRLVDVTYCACCQDITWHECLSLRHSLDEIGNAEYQVVGSRILA